MDALLYGSRARGTYSADRDADIAVILKGKPRNRFRFLGPLSDAAFDVLMETGILVQPLPIWESELERPELFGNPALIESIKREGVRQAWRAAKSAAEKAERFVAALRNLVRNWCRRR